MEEFAKSTVEKMIRQYGVVSEILKNYHGYDVWVLSDGTTIKLPADYSRIDEGYVSLIAETKLRIGSHEYDYWLGQQ